MIQDRRGEVLQRAISALENSTHLTIGAVAHEIGGSLGFYGFDRIGLELVEFSRTIAEVKNIAEDEFIKHRGYFLSALGKELAVIKGASDG